MKSVVLVGMIGGYEGEMNEPAEVWGCNSTFLHGGKLDRLYCMDWLDVKKGKQGNPDYVKNINELGFPFFGIQSYPDVYKSVRFPIEDIVKEFGSKYFTSTPCYMLAHAIYEGYEHIILHRLHCIPYSVEYFNQKACLDFWCGVAIGRKIKISTSNDSFIARSHPWESNLYGYQRSLTAPIIEKAIAIATLNNLENPLIFENASAEVEKILGNLASMDQVVRYEPNTKTCYEQTMKRQIEGMPKFREPKIIVRS